MQAGQFLRWIRALRITTDPRYPSDRKIPYHGRTVAGVYVNSDRALMTSTVWAAHRYLTQTVAQLPVRVMVETANGSSRPITRHRVSDIMSWQVNTDPMTPFQFKETMVGYALMHGNGVAEIEFDMVGQPLNLWPIHPSRLKFSRALVPMTDSSGAPIPVGGLVYEVDNGIDGGGVSLAAQNVFHIRGFGNGPVGLNVMEYAAQSIGWAQAAQLFGASFFGNGLNTGGQISGASAMDEKVLERLMMQLEETHGGPYRAHKPLLLDGGFEYKKTSATPEESQFIETMQFQVEEICRWMGVPPHKVMHLLRATFSNIEHQSIEVVVDSITPWAIRFEEECNAKLFGRNRRGLFVKLDLKGLLRGDFLTRQQGLQIQRRNGVINADFWAEIEDMPQPGSANGGDVYFIEGNNMVPQKRAAEPPVAQPSSTPPSTDQPPAANENMAALAILAGAAELIDAVA